MNMLKRIPVQYKGELHDVRLINFSVPLEEVRDKVPSNIKIRDFKGRALISMVDVKLKNMHPLFVPSLFTFDYRHVAFRLLVEDSIYNEGVNKGIYFYRSFTDKPLIIAGSKLLTDYNLEFAKFEEKDNIVTISQSTRHVTYCVDDTTDANNEDLKKTVGALDRAYSVLNNTIRVTQIQREKWPIQSVTCSCFENTFFKSPRLEGAFRVFETIYYQWLPPKPLVA